MKQRLMVTAVLLSLLCISSVSLAVTQTGHTEQKQPTMKTSNTEVFADGIQATFTVMSNEYHKEMLKVMKMNEEIEPGSTHHVMIQLRDDRSAELNNIPVTIKVIDADNNEQVKKGNFNQMMRTFDAYFNIHQKERYQIKVLFETKGQKRVIGISYERG